MLNKTASLVTHFIYILECADSTLYCGYTTDLKRRVAEHNDSKKGARYTKARRPVTLKYSEEFKTVGAALKREAEIKGWARAKKIRLVDGTL